MQKLADDHSNAKILAEGLSQIDGISVDLNLIETNIVIINISGLSINETEFAQKAKEVGVWCVPFGKSSVRFVTHLDLSEADCREAVARIEGIL